MEITEFRLTAIELNLYDITLTGRDQNGIEHTIKKPIRRDKNPEFIFPNLLIDAIANCKEYVGLPKTGNYENIIKRHSESNNAQ